MPSPGPLRSAILAVMTPGETRSITQLTGEINGTVISPGAAARAAEKGRRCRRGTQHPPPPVRVRQREAWVIIQIGSQRLIAQTLHKMFRNGDIERVAPGVYRRVQR